MIELKRDADFGAVAPEARTLVEGTFHGRDAKDLMVILVDATIDSQKLLNLRSELRHQQPDAECTQRIQDLEAIRTELSRSLGAIASGVRVKISATIEPEDESEAFSVARAG